MDPEPSRGEDRRRARVLNCPRCDGLGFVAPRIEGETCAFCDGHGRLVERSGVLTPLETPDEEIDRSWTAGGREWLWGETRGHRDELDELEDY